MNVLTNETEMGQKQQLRRARAAVVLISFIALLAAFFAYYAFEQKKKADDQTRIANQKARDAERQRQIARDQRKVADSNREAAQGLRDNEYLNRVTVAEERARAEAQAKDLEKSRAEVLLRKYEAEREKNRADTLSIAVQQGVTKAATLEKMVETQTDRATAANEYSQRLTQLAYSRKMASESVNFLNENRPDSAKIKALQAYELNKKNDGPVQSNDIYNALNINWIKSINNKNQFSFHEYPVRCIAGAPGSNIIFTADENGTLCESVLQNNKLQKTASYIMNEEVRAMAISRDGNKLVAITASGDGAVFNISASAISIHNSFKFPGTTGKAVVFSSQEDFILISNNGIGKYQVTNTGSPDFLSREGLSDIVIGKSDKIYIASGNTVKIYNNWNDLTRNRPAFDQKLDSRVTSLAVDEDEKYMAAGTYSGFVGVYNLLTRQVLWNRIIHNSSVNDLKFAKVDNSKLQLASAGADREIKLIDIDAIAMKNYAEEILTLKGHTKWIYSLYYTQNGKWLLSAGEDNKLIAWKPSMSDLYQSLLQ